MGKIPSQSVLQLSLPRPVPGRQGTAPGWIDETDVDAHLRTSLESILLSRARIVLGLLAASCVFFFATRALAGGEAYWTAQIVRAANFAAIVAIFAWGPGRSATRGRMRPEWSVLLACCVSIACSGAVCTIEGDTVNTGLGVAVVAISTAAYVPWSLRHQLALAAFGAAILLANALALGEYHRTVESITVTTAVLSILATVVVCGTLENARRRGAVDELRRIRAERRLREANEDLERCVQVRTRDLREVVQELQAFNYSVSHDLRSPLRHINGMSQLLEEEYGRTLDETASAYLGRLKIAAARMGQLIDALLARSRVGQAEMHVESVDLVDLAKTVSEDLRASERGRRVEWRFPDTITVDADRTLMAVVMQHLIGNAWKFTRSREPARIEMGERRTEAGREFFVRDNGVGFDMKNAGKLCENFQRLHGEEYEGTGIGLATVARIVARHGGSIRLQSAADLGTTVSFTLGDAGNPS